MGALRRYCIIGGPLRDRFSGSFHPEVANIRARCVASHEEQSRRLDCIVCFFYGFILSKLSSSQDQFQKLGGIIRDNEVVTAIEPGPVVTVTTAARVYRAKSVVITVGAWANKLLAQTGLQLPLEVPCCLCEFM